VELLGIDPQSPDWIYVRTVDKSLSGWTQRKNLRIHRALRDVPEITPVPTLTPTATATPSPTPTPTVACLGGPFSAEAWAIEKFNLPEGGWKAIIYTRGHGGDCAYTYAWNELGEIKGGPTHEGVMFEVTRETRTGTIVGTVLVISGDQTLEVGIHVYSPDTD
jgi:hypothetical protein